jgi:hypothetical protein
LLGAGSTITAASALGLRSVGLEISREYFDLAVAAIPRLAALPVTEPNLRRFRLSRGHPHPQREAGTLQRPSL